MSNFKEIKDIEGILPLNMNSYLPFKGFFDKKLEQDINFFAQLNAFLEKLFGKMYQMAVDESYIKYAPFGCEMIEDPLSGEEVHMSEERARKLVRMLLDGRGFQEVKSLVNNTSKARNKLLIDIRKKGGEYPYSFILDMTYHMDLNTIPFKGLKEGRIEKEISEQYMILEFERALRSLNLSTEQEWINLGNAMIERLKAS